MPRTITLVALAVTTLLGCQDTSTSGLDAEGPPRILQVFARERVLVTDDDGHESLELQNRLAFGDHEDIDADHDDRVVTQAVARDGQRLRVVVDELLRGNNLEEIPCADGSWSRVPLGTDFDEIARCAGADLSKCRAVCLDGAGAPLGILDANQDGAIDDTRLIDGAVVLTCDGAPVALDRDHSYYQPSGSQRLSGGSIGTDSLGPAIVVTTAEGMKPNARCGLGFASTVVDKAGLALCAEGNAGCNPGDTAAIQLTVEPFTLASSDPHDGATEVEMSDDAAIRIQLNAALDPATVHGAVKLTVDGHEVEDPAIELDAHDDAALLVTVDGGFHAGVTYVVTVAGGTSGLRDAHADTLPADTTITFTTKAEAK